MSKTYGPYSSYQETTGLIFTAGQIGAANSQAPEGIKDQTQLALENLSNVLDEAGSNLGEVLKTTVYLTDMSHFADMNEVYARVFAKAGSSPARSTVAVAALPPVANCPLLVEIEAVARKKSK